MHKEQLTLYFICGTQDCNGKDIVSVVTEALEAGITLYQFREKGDKALTGQAKKDLAQRLMTLCHNYSVPFIVNDDVTLALELGADGVHIGQDDMPPEKARQLFPDKIVGLSISNMEEYQHSSIDLVDYIGVGPIFPTISKADAKEPVGNKVTQAIRQVNPDLPIVAIGGITPDDLPAIKQSGADGVAVISAISHAISITNRVSVFLKNWQNT